MLAGKEIIIGLLKQAIASFNNTDQERQTIITDIDNYKTFLTNFTSPVAITQLSTEMLDRLVENIVPAENQATLVAKIKLLQDLMVEDADQNYQKNLAPEQLMIVEEVKELIIRTISKNQFLISVLNDKAGKAKTKYQELLTLIENNELIKESDYDLLAELVRNYCTVQFENTWDKVLTYLNVRNAEKLGMIFNGQSEKPIIAEESEINDQVALEVPVKPKAAPESERIEIKTAKLEQKLLDFIQKSREKYRAIISNPIEKEKVINTFFDELGFNYEHLDLALKNQLLLYRNVYQLKRLVDYLKSNQTITSNLNPGNLEALAYILSESNEIIIEKVLRQLVYVHDVSDPDLKKIINLMTPIFGEKGSKNFLANAKIFEQYGIDLQVIINSSINVLVVNNKKLREIVKVLSKYPVDIKGIIEKCAIAIGKADDLLIHNIKILENYGFDLTTFFAEKSSSYVILNCYYLAEKIDQIIEAGLGEEIHREPGAAGAILTRMIVKKVSYCFKNNLLTWEKASDSESLISKRVADSGYIIDEPEIRLLVAEHSILGALDDGYRPAIFSLTPLALIRRRTQFQFDQTVISRLKVFRVFKLAIDHGLSESEALLYAITYKTALSAAEYQNIKYIIEKLGG